MKKIVLSGLCGVLLVGSVQQTRADESQCPVGGLCKGLVKRWSGLKTEDKIWMGFVVSVIGLWTAGVIHGCKESTSSAQYARFKIRNGHIFDILTEVKSNRPHAYEKAADEVVALYAAKKEKCHDAIRELDRAMKRLIEFRQWFKNDSVNSLFACSREHAKKQLEEVKKVIAVLGEVILTIKDSCDYCDEQWEREKSERKQDLREERQFQVDLLKAKHPANNELGLKIS